MIRTLNKTVKKIENWQESCADFQLFIRTLLGESILTETSIADVAVKVPESGDVKKRKLTENEKMVVTKDDMGNFVIDGKPVDRETQTKLKNALDRDQRVVDIIDKKEENESDVSPLQEPSGQGGQKPRASETTSRDKIIRTERYMQINNVIQKWIKQYFSNRRSGNFGEASIVKRKIENMISEKDLDRDTVFYAGSISNDVSDSEPDASE